MATDMDIDMDLDIDIGGFEDGNEDFTTHAEPILSDPQETHSANSTHGAPTDPDGTEIAANKVHLRGLDNLTTDDIKAFASTYHSAQGFEKIEWIDDTSANIVYPNAQNAREALNSFSAEDINHIVELPMLQLLTAKSFPAHPETRLQIRLAVVGDRKQAGARERSRFYLFNPEYDKTERRKREGGGRGGARRYRDRDDGGYRNQIYDDRENKRRQEAEPFDASLYDDDDQALAARLSRRSSTSSNDHRGGRGQARGYGKELFPDKARASGRLRDRSASPLRDGEGDGSLTDLSTADRQARRLRNERGSAENRHKASLLKNALKDANASGSRELFPKKSTGMQRKPSAFDATDETADLFANKASIREAGVGLNSEVTKPDLESRVTTSNGFIIKGAAKPELLPEYSIKGAAAVKELFPLKSGNAGKELFGDKLEGRGGQRRRAEDMFR